MKYIVTDNTVGVNVYVGENKQIANKFFDEIDAIGHTAQTVEIFQAKEEKEEEKKS